MNLLHASLFVSALIGVSGCPTRSKYDQLPIVRITSPAPDTYTNGPVTITATIDPDLDLPIVLRLDSGGIIKTLASASESYVWNTIGCRKAPTRWSPRSPSPAVPRLPHP